MRKTTAAQKKANKTEALVRSVHRVVAAYIAHMGGKVLVSGPLQIQVFPMDKEGFFTVALKCVGRKPERPYGDQQP
jgi:hypothetical protein